MASVASVTLNWRVMFGAVAQSAMFDDGVHGDGGPDDDVVRAAVAVNAVVKHRRLRDGAEHHPPVQGDSMRRWPRRSRHG